ncbi:PLD nuclease N-terminal domain-containing protein [Planococcus sp. ISL-109]|uniref:PLD nuclease N-terminal domain-containing protein n=1 Tax=Planococcus sp. ISL-109 TaxID=2819166 RepID=UPI001BE6A212|nr:PLD nuclease N-terminal domain-containing protein [Planococcus sp. ISL-109]MBT2582694.1 PLDc_N domain-containing protein [Planococcus sp. ISL-109]
MNMIDEQALLLVLPILLLQLALMIFALVDLIKNPNPNGPKWMWAAIIVLLNIIGPILYFIIGRRNY